MPDRLMRSVGMELLAVTDGSKEGCLEGCWCRGGVV